MYDSVEQGTWAIYANTATIRNSYVQNNSNADQDAVLFKAFFQAGTYTCRLPWMRYDYGIFGVDIDDVRVLTQDMYGLWSPFQLKTVTGIVIATSGVKTVRVIADGKHPSSPNYVIPWKEITFYRTA